MQVVRRERMRRDTTSHAYAAGLGDCRRKPNLRDRGTRLERLSRCCQLPTPTRADFTGFCCIAVLDDHPQCRELIRWGSLKSAPVGGSLFIFCMQDPARAGLVLAGPPCEERERLGRHERRTELATLSSMPARRWRAGSTARQCSALRSTDRWSVPQASQATRPGGGRGASASSAATVRRLEWPMSSRRKRGHGGLPRIGRDERHRGRA